MNSTNPLTKKLNTSLELKQISREVKFKRPSEIIYNTNCAEFDKSQYMTKHRSNLANSKLSQEKSKSRGSLQRDISMLLDPIQHTTILEGPHQDLISSIGLRAPEKLFTLSTKISELKEQVDKCNPDILSEDALNIDADHYRSFIRAGFISTSKNSKISGKKDADMLEDWLDFMLNQILKDTNNLFENSQIVYTTALQEIIRQVGGHCTKRGELLNRIWKAYFHLMVSAIRSYQESKLVSKMKAVTVLKNAECKHTEQLRVLTNDLARANQELMALKFENNSLKSIVDKQKYSSKVMENKYSLLLSLYQKNKLVTVRLEDTNKNLNHLIGTVLEDLDSELPGMKKVGDKKKIRFRDLSKIFNSDPLLNSLDSQAPEIITFEVPMTDVEMDFERQKIEMENSQFLQDVKRTIDETEEELVDSGVDTSEFIIFRSAETQTLLDDFVIPLVSVDKSIKNLGKITFEDAMMKIIGTEDEFNENQLEVMFPFKSEQDFSDLESDDEQLECIPKKELNEISQEKILQMQIIDIVNNNYLRNNKKYKKLLMKTKKLRRANENYENSLMNLRKVLYVTIKEKKAMELRISSFKRQPTKRNNKIKSNFPRASEKKIKITHVKEFNLSKNEPKPPSAHIQIDFTSPAKAIIDNVIKGKYTEKLSMTKKAAIKYINSFVSEFQAQSKDNKNNQQQTLCGSFYSWFTLKYTNPKVGKSNFSQCMLAFYSYSSTCNYIKLFARFIGFFDPLDLEYFGMYLEINSKLEATCKSTEMFEDSNDEVCISLFKCEEAIASYWKHDITDEEHQDLREKLKKCTKQCPKNLNLCGVVYIYDFIDLNILKYSQYLEKARNSNKDLFNGADLSRDGLLSIDEFEMIFRIIEKSNYTKFYSHLLFTSFSEICINSRGKEYQALNYNKFSYLCIEKGLFKLEAQNKFLGITSNKEIPKLYENMYNNREVVIKELKWRTAKLKEQRYEFIKIINLLKAHMAKNIEERAIYIGYRLIEADTKEKIIEEEVKNSSPSIFEIFDKAKTKLDVDRNPPRRETRIQKHHEQEENEEDLFYA